MTFFDWLFKKPKVHPKPIHMRSKPKPKPKYKPKKYYLTAGDRPTGRVFVNPRGEYYYYAQETRPIYKEESIYNTKWNTKQKHNYNFYLLKEMIR